MVLSAGLVLVLAYLGYTTYATFRRFRFMQGTATSKIRAAAQGYVELKGLGEWMPGDTILSPFSGRRCVWFHCTIEKKKRTGKNTTWINISDEYSGALFQLVDNTGICIIDPDDAQVAPEIDLTWYGDNATARSQAPRQSNWLRLGLGNYRFRERLLLTASPLYALGWFRTTRTDLTDENLAKQIDDLVKQWRLQPERYLGAYDLDHNGKIQKQEWRVIRAAAREQVLAAKNRENKEHHVMSRPQQERQPYILSAVPEEDLVLRKKWLAYSSMVAAFLVFGTLVVMFSTRTPFPV
jgi:hypothetical protein